MTAEGVSNATPPEARPLKSKTHEERAPNRRKTLAITGLYSNAVKVLVCGISLRVAAEELVARLFLRMDIAPPPTGPQLHVDVTICNPAARSRANKAEKAPFDAQQKEKEKPPQMLFQRRWLMVTGRECCSATSF